MRNPTLTQLFDLNIAKGGVGKVQIKFCRTPVDLYQIW